MKRGCRGHFDPLQPGFKAAQVGLNSFAAGFNGRPQALGFEGYFGGRRHRAQDNRVDHATRFLGDRVHIEHQ